MLNSLGAVIETSIAKYNHISKSSSLKDKKSLCLKMSSQESITLPCLYNILQYFVAAKMIIFERKITIFFLF